MTDKTVVELIERLRSKYIGQTSYGGVRAGAYHEMLVNPDGPEAADELERLRSLAQAAGYTDVGEALKAIPVKDAALDELADAGEEAWGKDRPCVRFARQALANGGTA